MNQSLLWRGLLILAVAAVAAFSAYPPAEKVRLGLDLKGGMHLVLEVETEDALAAETDKDIERLITELEDDKVVGVAGRQDEADPNRFVLTGLGVGDDSKLGDIADDFLPGWTWSRSGGEVRFVRRDNAAKEIAEQAVRQAEETIRNRVDAFGVAEHVIHRQGLGSNRLVVQLPGVDDPERVKDLIQRTAFLEFRITAYPPDGRPAADRQEILDFYGGTLPEDVEIVAGLEQVNQNQVDTVYALQRRRIITGRDLKDARPALGEFNEPVVNFSLTPEGAKLFGDATEKNVNRGLAIVLDGVVKSAPKINSRITDSGVITGVGSQQEVEDLSTVLRSGALPAQIKYLYQNTVGPSLGQDSIDQGLRAGLVGAGLVVVLMLVVYKGAGINAVVALMLNVVLLFGALSYFGATLTLPGIAGIVLTIGMAVDANVLIFERIREELHSGRTVKAAVASGFGKALSSILDANTTTLIAAMFLFNFGTGPIRGFAVTLSIGILASVFTAVVASRWIFDLLLSRPGRVERISI
jgi:preprotein translocase subunit SecD